MPPAVTSAPPPDPRCSLPGDASQASTAQRTGAQAPAGADAVLDLLAAPAHSSLPEPKLLLVFAHPDDEVVAVGGRMERLRFSRLITLTDGAPVDGADARDHGFPSLSAYRDARRGEQLASLCHAGLPATVAGDFPGRVPDQQASFHLASLALAVAQALQDFQPVAVLTHPVEGGHPDHDAAAFAVHAAVRLLQSRTGISVPVLEAPFYHASAQGSLRSGSFLPSPGLPAERVCVLSAEEQRNKQARFACFSSQTRTLDQFGITEERFRSAPSYDFTRSPHPGRLLYEHFPWGMDGEQFRRLAAAAFQTLFGPHPAGTTP